ncbi:thiamine biosynthesis protein ThiC, partial [candidate division WOR-1 bacterium DG_54_3]
MTQREEALKGNITEAMQWVARDEGRSPEEIRVGLAQGVIVIPFNPLHKNCKAIGIGKGLRTKVNANIGTSADFPN